MRRLLFAMALLPAAPGLVRALPCNFCNSVAPACIRLVGSTGGVPADEFGSFQVLVRDVGNNPVAGIVVIVDLAGCPDLHLCADQRDPGVIVNCPTKTVRRRSAADGSARFTLLGGSNGPGHAVSLLGAARIYVNDSLIGTATASAFDLDGVGGVGINDLSVWLTDFGWPGNPPFGRSDYDCSGSVGINDLSVWLAAFGSGTQFESCGATCP